MMEFDTAVRMAGSFMLAIAVLLFLDWGPAAWIVAGLLVAAIVALIFGKFCLGSYLSHTLRGDAAFANGTLPWASQTASRQRLASQGRDPNSRGPIR